MKRASTYGLRLDQMKRLFAMSREELNPGGERDENQQMKDLLREQLTRPLPRGTLFCDVLLMVMDQAAYDTKPLTGKSLREVLMSPQSDVSLLQAIKESSKKLSSTLDSEAEAALATTLYYAAIAGALVFHDRRITQNSPEKLAESFSLLIEKKWMTEELIDLFSRARHICAHEKDDGK